VGDNIPGASGQLSQQQLYVVLALVALAQTGCTFNSLSILKMLPQPPIPMFNMSAKGSSDTPASSVPQPAPAVHPVSPAAAMPYQVPVSAPVAAPASMIPNTPIPATPSAVSLQQPAPAAHQVDSFFSSDPKEDDFTEFQSADISAIPTATVVQPSSAAKQVVSELNHSVIARLGNQGRSIGSRLANHTLGAPKTSRSHHHKHHRPDRRPSIETPYFDDEVTFGGGRSRKLSNDNSRDPYVRHQHGDESETDDFNDFQMAIGLNVNVDELFPKCKQIKKRTVLLKESAIRNESEEKPEVAMLALDAPVPEPVNSLAEPESVVPPPLQPPPQTISAPPQRPALQPPPSQTQAPPPTGKELMTVQEDKYSALRFLELESTTTPSDDFGDFVSAEDSFAEITERRPSDSALNLFASAPEDVFPAISESNTGRSLFAELEPTATKVETNPVDDWLSFESSAAPASNAPTENSRPNLEDLNSIFSSLDMNAEPKPQLQVSVTEDTEDEFGDFVGPDMWGGDEQSGKLPATLFSDNRSVSSFEMANASLSRHGSLPSLDLKIFPQGDDSLDKFREGCVPINEWQRCLECCVSLLQSAVNTFDSISSQDVVLEVLGTTEGRSYFTSNYLSNIHYLYAFSAPN